MIGTPEIDLISEASTSGQPYAATSPSNFNGDLEAVAKSRNAASINKVAAKTAKKGKGKGRRKPTLSSSPDVDGERTLNGNIIKRF